MDKATQTRIRELTMACWWPNGAYPGTRTGSQPIKGSPVMLAGAEGPNWDGIIGELGSLLTGAEYWGDVTEIDELKRLIQAALL